MKIAKFVATAAIGSLLSAPLMASNDVVESHNEIRNTYQHEHSEKKVPEWAEQERERHTERNRFERHLADDDGDGFKLEAQHRYQNREQHQTKYGGGDFGRSSSTGSSGRNAGGASSGSGKGSNGRH